MRATKLGWALLGLLAVNTAAAQAPPPKKKKWDERDPAVAVQTKLNFDREVFTYPGDGRKDPFRPLVGTDAVGPLFEDLTLRGIIYSTNPRMSVATITDGAKPPRVYKKRVGEVIGNARIASIDKTSVKLLVQSYGVIREETMNLATRLTPAQMAANAQQADQERLGQLFQQELLRAITGQTGGQQQGVAPGTVMRDPNAPDRPRRQVPNPLTPRDTTRRTTTQPAPTNRQPIRRNEER